MNTENKTLVYKDYRVIKGPPNEAADNSNCTNSRQFFQSLILFILTLTSWYPTDILPYVLNQFCPSYNYLDISSHALVETIKNPAFII